MVSIHVVQGWPIAFAHMSYLVAGENLEKFVTNYPKSAGADLPEVIHPMIAINVAIGTLLVLVSCYVAEIATRCARAFTSAKTARSHLD